MKDYNPYECEFDFYELSFPEVITFQYPTYTYIAGFEPRYIIFNSEPILTPSYITFKINRYLYGELHSIWYITADCLFKNNIMIYFPTKENPPELEWKYFKFQNTNEK